MIAQEDRHEIRLCDLSPFDTVAVRCECGRIVEYLPGVLARLHRVPAMAVIAELKFRCTHCGRRSGFGISLADERNRGDSAKNHIERVIVPGRFWVREC
jgi:hypothetical protein